MKKIPKLKPIQLRNLSPIPEVRDNLPRNEIYFILDNIMDTFNVGGIFRLSDAVAVKKVYLCGITEAPPNTKVKKASVNTWQWVDWQYTKTTFQAIKKIRKEVKGIKIIAVEQADNSVDYTKAKFDFPIALVMGHETKGIDKKILKKCDEIVEIPMHGVNVSLNVIVSLGIVAYKALEKNKING